LLDASLKKWQYSLPHRAKTVKHMPVNLRNRRADMSRPSQTGTVGSASTQRVRRLLLLSTFSRGTSGVTLGKSLLAFYIHNMLTLTRIMWAYIFFNFAVVFVCTWLYLGGARKIKALFSPSARKQKKERKQRQSGDQA
jgi:hypothetical protein